MLSKEQIENIIKPNKEHYEIRKHDIRDGYIFFFDNDFLDSRVELLNNEPDKLRLYLARYYKVNYRWLEMTIENNAIELKHYLDIEITKQDIIDWLSSIGFKHNNNYVESNKDYLCLYKTENVDYEINGSATAEIESSFLFIPRYKTAHIPIHKKFKKELKIELFKATNSNEYWRLYNIIKNLKV